MWCHRLNVTKYLESLNHCLLHITQAEIIRSRKNDVPVWMKKRGKQNLEMRALHIE